MPLSLPLSPTLPTTLLLIDNQTGFLTDAASAYFGPSRSNPNYEKNMQSLLSAFRSARHHQNKNNKNSNNNNISIIHIAHSSLDPACPLHPSHPSNGIAFIPFAAPDEGAGSDEPVLWKCVNSAFIGTELEAMLRARGTRQLVVAGLTTDHCVSTSVRMAANLGVVNGGGGGGEKGRILLVGDACSAFEKGGFDAETVHAVSLASLDGEFAEVVGTAEVVAGLGGV
ncbi:hypothetical protein FQN53_000541 [Emmonsiellopsis sp. PD_33]|nr:hypothetical protein FQN53_000541 [Emmonsiellopsis sp. PD_33]